MRLIATMNCKPGMRLGKPIYTSKGQTLVNYQAELTAKIISRLHTMGYEYLYIDDPRTEDIYIEDAIRMETRMALRMSIERIMSQVASQPTALSSGQLSISSACADSLTMVMHDLMDAPDDIIMLTNASPPQSNLYNGHFVQHAVNVCVFAAKIGTILGLSSKDLAAFSLGALLHDIGNLRLNPDILYKPSSLTVEEYKHIRLHAELGFDMLKNEPGIPITSALCALNHHERIDGTGYPNKLKGSEIHSFARWVGIIDAYDAMTNPRPHRKALLPHEAMEILYTGACTLYDYDKVELFRKKLAIFPVGLSVSLTSGEHGIVSRINREYIQRPVVRILSDSTGFPLKQPYEVDLSRKLNVMINRIGEPVAMSNMHNPL
jgi:HD-GYP domain-containing protein (c-di-GMP phosphodiesterase class II)